MNPLVFRLLDLSLDIVVGVMVFATMLQLCARYLRWLWRRWREITDEPAPSVDAVRLSCDEPVVSTRV